MTEADAQVLIPALPPRRRYTHVVRAITGRPWAIEARTGREIVSLINARLAGDPRPAPVALEPVTAETAEPSREASAGGFEGAATGGFVVGTVAVIPVHGVIAHRMSLMDELCASGASCEAIRHDVQEAIEDPEIRAIVLDVDSPGGSTDGVTELAAWLRQARTIKPIVASVNTLCASAAVWLVSSCSEIAITPSGEIGSIGVYAVHEDDSGLLEMAGVRISYVYAGDYKVELARTAPLSEDARVYVQGQVDTFYRMFVADVAAGLDISSDKVVADFGQGRMLLAKDARAAGLVDRIESIDATVDRLNKRPQSGALRGTARAIARAAAADAGPAVDIPPTSFGLAAHAPAQPAAPAADATPTRADRDWNRRMQRQRGKLR